MRHTRGFTLVELLVVIGVIAVLAGFSLGIAAHLWKSEYDAQTHGELAVLRTALEEYHSTQGYYPAPGHPDDEDPSLDGRLFHALVTSDANPTGTLSTWEPTQFGVADGAGGFRNATLGEQTDPRSKVALLDHHHRPYHYREREAHPQPDALYRKFELWAEGMNRADDGGSGDDIAERR
jgi:prepilin-type N-terminal cleavage/methylation domain-containing protein